MRIIAISNAKGGVGKTTTALNLAAALFPADEHGSGVMIDMDPQGSLTYSLGVTEPEYSVVDAMRGDLPVRAVKVDKSRADLIPGSLRLLRVELDIARQGAAYYEAFDNMIASIRRVFPKRRIIVDCPPALGLLHAAVIQRAEYIITPVEPEMLALKSFKDYREAITEIQGKKAAHRVLITKYDNRKSLHRIILNLIREDLGGQVFDTVIRTNVALAEAPAQKVSVFDYAPRSSGAEDYANLAEEIRREEQ